MPLRSTTSSFAIAFALTAGLVAGPAAGQAPGRSPAPTGKFPTGWGVGSELIPREVFFGNPDRAQLRISPDGGRLSYLAAVDGVLNVWVETIGGNDARAVTTAKSRPVQFYFWAMNGEQILYGLDRGGDENFHIFAADLDTGAERDLTPLDGIQARITAVDRDHPDEILVSVNDRDPRYHDVWRVNTRTGERELIFENDGRFVSVLADADYQVRLAGRMNPSGGLEFHLRDAEDAPWYELVRWGPEDSLTSGVLGFSRSGKTLYLTDSRSSDTGGLYAYSIGADEGPTYELIVSDPRTDVADVVLDPKTGTPQAVAFEYTRREWRTLDPSIQADWKILAGVADGDMSIVSRTLADDKWLVSYTRDDGPVSYYLHDRARGETQFICTNRSELERYELAKMRPVVIEARDGLKLVSYLTLPRNARSKDLPMVLLVHGGPWARDRWGYNPIHQWLANRGYAVLSVNFRGSTGFGKAFVNAGDREWSGKMHDDLIDAVNWAVTEGIADPTRVAIMGGSYGGYATLVGLAFTPDFFAVGVDIVGPSHVGTLLRSIPEYFKGMLGLFESRVARLDETEFLDQISPLTAAGSIRRPLLIGQGRNDPRVKETESQQIVDAMVANGQPVTYVVFPDEGHGFRRPVNSQAFFAITEVFLAEHLGGRYEPIDSAVRRSSAEIPVGAALIPGLE